MNPPPNGAVAPRTVRERTRQDYDAVAAGWQAWEPHIVAFSWPVTHRLLDAVELRAGMHVLDVGCGIGDPTVAIASRVGPTGRVTAIDLSPRMIEVARQRAASLGLAAIDFRVCAIEEFDAAPASFDAVVGRWSLIFCEDVAAQLARIRGWLRPGGRLAMSTWTPMEQSLGFAAINRAVNRVAKLPPLDPCKPGMQNLSTPGHLADALGRAGFVSVGAEPVRLSTVVRDGDEYWRMSCEMGASLRAVLHTLSEEQIAAIGSNVAQAVEEFRCGAVLRIPSVAQVGWGSAGPPSR
ncbi:MAG: class I SAM-dependent methyltransferase [Phycisphaerae bacterium]|nr:class I SAM-dependent methyltransferase [Phycisphaerae bacterium]